jgi:hypothetical protein
MSNFAEDEPRGPLEDAIAEDAMPEDAIRENAIHDGAISEDAIHENAIPEGMIPQGVLPEPLGDPTAAVLEPLGAELPLFHSFTQPEPAPPARIPHLGHFLLLLVLLLAGFAGAIVVLLLALHFHLDGVSTVQGTKTNIHYTLGSEGLGYLFCFLLSLAIFPLLWHQSLFAGVQWNVDTAIRLRWRLVSAAALCMGLALLNTLVLPGPKHAPIEDIFREPGAAWLLFAFGVTVAPFFEELCFRGFLLPALCTAYDWCAEKMYRAPRLPLAEDGHPQWSFAAMATGAVVTSIPFAWLHAAQTGYSIGPFLLLVGVSIVLCAVRLWTRSLASSTLVHASYNFMLFSIMLIGTQGFRHLDKM